MIAAGELRARATALLDAGQRLALVAAHDDTDAIRVVYLFLDGPRRTELEVRLDRDRPVVPSLADVSFPAGRFEREMQDLFGVVPEGHPQPRRLVAHHHWPRGWHPMLHDAGEPPEFGDREGPFPFVPVEGPGVYEIPVGPVHAGLIEPGHFRFSVVGESILRMKARLWFVHRGIEALFEGRTPADGLELAERVSGDTSIGHALAYCRAVEAATGCAVPAEAERIRAVLLELERLYNHAGDLGALCNDVGYGILNAHALRVRETLLRLNDEVTGHRLLRGGVVPGGAEVRGLPTAARLSTIAADLAEIAALALGHSTVLDRFTGTGVLTVEQVGVLGVLGFAARASGSAEDARVDQPGYAGLVVPTETGGDVLARFKVRVAEVAASVDLLADLLDGLAPGRFVAPLPRAGRAGVGVVEGWRGAIVQRVELAPDGALARVRIVDPSFFNWPALPVALTGAIVPDFPLINKSFNLSYAGNDL